MDWLLLVDGAPDATDDPWDHPEAIPDPFSFFRVLCSEVAGIQPGRMTIEEDLIEPREQQLMRGYQGTEQIGVRFTEHRSLATSMVPVFARHESYGLPEMELIWEYCWHYAGQAGHSIFKHRSLQIRFATPAAQAQFERIWHSMFGKIPHFQPVASAAAHDERPG